MRLFRFINMKQQLDSLDNQKIHYQINLATYEKMELNGALEVNYLDYKTIGGLLGGGSSINFKNKNLRGGGEILSTNIELNAQLLTSVRPIRFFSYDGKFQTDLLLPRYNDFYFRHLARNIDKEMLNLDQNAENSKVIAFYSNLKDNASTKFSLIVNPFSSRDLVSNRIGLSYGFQLPLNQESQLSFNHIGLEYYAPRRPDLSRITEEDFYNIFKSQLSTGFILKDINFQRKKINSTTNEYRNARIGIEFSGIELYGINALYNVIAKKQGAFNILGSKVDYGRYIRFETEWSRGISLGKQVSFHYHFKGGVAKTFGYEGSVPFARQFFVGGAASIRGWNWRGLGPGASDLQLNKPAGSIFFQSGDVQLETNAEFRFPLFWIFKMAAFVDVGNIWNINNRSDQKALFTNQFYKQLAVSSGLGFRMDFGYALLRVDIGSKIRTPYLNTVTNNHFYYSKAEPFSFNKLVYNLALGYPF
jgi:outer membrane protein assembly factor BamA